MVRKISLFILIFGVCLCQISAQESLTNEEKYHLLRERLRNEFMLYTGDGMEQSTSLPMERIYQSKHGKTAYWADAVWWQGHYLALLSTEYALFQRDGKPTDTILKEIHCALEVYDRLDLAAEPCWLCDTFTQPNGFYLRDDIPLSDTSRFGVQWIESDYCNHCGRPNTTGNAPSQDQAWASYIGLAMVQKLVDDEESRKKAGEIGGRIVAFMQHKEDGRVHWSIVNPVNGSEIQPEIDIYWLQYAHSTIGSMLSGHPVGMKRASAGRSIWNVVQDNMFISKTGNYRWYGILSMSTVMNDAGSGKDCYKWLLKTCDKIVRLRPDLQQELIFPNLPLINLVLYGQEGKKLLPRERYETYLDSAPADGCMTRTIDGKIVRNAPPWHSLSLFCPWHVTEIGEVNMIDYLLLYNLVELVYGSKSEN